MNTTTNPTLTYDAASFVAAMDRLVAIAKSDTGQSRRVADFLLAWWNGQENGHFDISHLFGVDTVIGLDIATVVAFIAAYPGAVYPDAFTYRPDMEELWTLWREPQQTPAEQGS